MFTISPIVLWADLQKVTSVFLMFKKVLGEDEYSGLKILRVSKAQEISIFHAHSFQMGHVYLGFIHALWIFQNSLHKSLTLMYVCARWECFFFGDTSKAF
jgi:hypothetical protein